MKTHPDTPVRLNTEHQFNGFAVLETLATLPVSSWRYTWDPEHVRHLGPMAQDWHAAFGLGDTDTAIDFIDSNGITIVAIQALHQLVTDLQQEITQLRSQLAALPQNTTAPFTPTS
ncbi:tail fiber domain-containing protein [Streptomyces racemochromogenes]|uniref:tail fiber domain-containing protein n=1 Tax=Streptomyces racemochromogenes TaxID=67353 RepID=UPI0031E7D987